MGITQVWGGEELFSVSSCNRLPEMWQAYLSLLLTLTRWRDKEVKTRLRDKEIKVGAKLPETWGQSYDVPISHQTQTLNFLSLPLCMNCFRSFMMSARFLQLFFLSWNIMTYGQHGGCKAPGLGIELSGGSCTCAHLCSHHPVWEIERSASARRTPIFPGCFVSSWDMWRTKQSPPRGLVTTECMCCPLQGDMHQG